MKAKSRNPVLFAITAALGISAGYAARIAHEKERPASKPVTQELERTVNETYTVSKVVDGDTIDIKEGVEVSAYRIRLLGIDTPERGQPFYREATEKLEELTAGRKVLLVRDANNTDRYGRLLRYIIADGQNLNTEMVRSGYARAYMHEGLRYERQILEAEREARQNKKGIWQN
jgi:micrococcal nuclease